ncbi:MAG: NAD(P)-dependent oxidoreductase [Rhodospirillaceae bacterium]|nr:NAD(P)-dependent oxidoreductase [Rhodospirillaceae bacterium]|tara:strand:+ start:9008 stop:9757 length:750 start_codon:yes stop_codon:yes gene_type:complete
MSKTVIVTGASRGIGAAIARRAGHQGWRVCVNYNGSPDKATEVASDVEQAGGEAFTFKASQGVESDLLALYDAVDEKWGAPDAVINNAGIDHEADYADTSWDDYLKVFNVNILGLMASCREAVRRMSTTRGGRGGAIVNIGSISARTGGLPGDVIYTATKGAVDSFTLGLAKEVGPQGIRVTCVRPGVIETDIFSGNEFGLEAVKELSKNNSPLQRIGQPDEVAAMAVFLASDDASFCTGMCYDVNGGR